jgi:FKBP-type peptidyl-prolyl cis-trans isomerase FklB
MKHILAIMLSVGFLFTLCFAEEKLELKDQTDKESYSLGYWYGQTLKAQGMPFNLGVYTSGIQDALKGADPLLNQEEINKTILEIQARSAAARQKQLKEFSDKNLALGKAFMEENAKKEGVKTLPGGSQYKVLKEGSGRTAKAGDEVTVNYKGTFVDGTEFDNTFTSGRPLTIQVDKVIPGWQEALLSMKEGSRWQLFIPPQLGYGEQGAGYIPPNSVLVFDVDLLAVREGSGPQAGPQAGPEAAKPMDPASGKTQ